MVSSPSEVRTAVTRQVSAAMMRCELTHLSRTQIDIGRAREQHRAYEQALRTLGCRIEQLPEEPALADSVFVEDTAIVLDEIAVVTRPGALSRRAETASVADALGKYRDVQHIGAPGTLDGGDVLRVAQTIYVGLSGRSNRSGIEQLDSIVARFGYRVEAIAVRGCLHLKSAVTQVGSELLLINPEFVDPDRFAGFDWIAVDPAEPLGANALLIDEAIIYPASKPRTAERLGRGGIRVHTVDVSELEKAEGAVTCCSLLLAAMG